MQKDLIQQIKQRLQLHDYMESAGVQFTSKSKDSWKARCWMHDDRTPSLVVSVRKGLYNCFSTGCEARGDILCFHEQFFNIERGQAIKELAGKCGIKYEDAQPNPAREIMEQVTEACAIQAFASKKTRDYLEKRGVTDDTAVDFRIGYSPSIAWIKNQFKGTDPELLRKLELDSYKYNDALVLPCVNPLDGQIAHYVRPFTQTKSKYMGPSSSNPSRWKGMMFGLQVARSSIRDTQNLILVEGQFDALVLHSHNLPNTVCMLGSHPSSEQIEVLRSIHVPCITVLFDADSAGDSGVDQVVTECAGRLCTKVAFLPEGDPDEFVLASGEDSLRRIIQQSFSPTEYILNKHAGSLEGDTDAVSKGLTKTIQDLARLPYEDYLAGVCALSKSTGIPADALLDLNRESQAEHKSVVESERQVLAASMQDLSAIMFIDGLPDEIWTLVKHKKIYGAIKDLVGKGVQTATVSLIESRLTDPLAARAVADLFKLETSNLEYHLGLLKEAKIRRDLKEAARKLAQNAANSNKKVEEVVSTHLQTMSSAASPTSKFEFTAGEVIEGAMDFIHDRMSNPGKLPGLDLGPKWRSTTKALLGLQNNRLYLIGAGPKVGKTTLGLNWAVISAVERKTPTLWINLEMSERDIAMRCLAMLSGISSLRVQAGTLDTKEKELIDSKAAEFYASPFHIFNAFGMSVQEILGAIRKYVYMHSVQIAFLDYVQLLNVSGEMRGADYWERHSFVSTQLKQAINANLGIPIVALSQLGRPASQEGSSSGAFIGGSYKYVQDCDTFMGLRVRTDKELEDGLGGNLVLNVEFNRHGPQDVYTRIHFNRDNLRMEEID
jgi:replicative DNA helicase